MAAGGLSAAAREGADLPRTAGAHRRRQPGSDRAAGAGPAGSVVLRRGRPHLRRCHGFVRDGHAAGPAAVEPAEARSLMRPAVANMSSQPKGGGTMNAKRIIIVGGVAGGASAAARARRLSEEAEIIVF